MENQSGDSISRILTIVLEILEDVRYLKEHRRMYLLSEVQEFIRKMRKQGKLEDLKDSNQ